MTTAAMHPDAAMTEPTDKSKLPEAMHSIIEQETIPAMEIAKLSPAMFRKEKKLSIKMEQPMNKPAKTSNIPALSNRKAVSTFPKGGFFTAAKAFSDDVMGIFLIFTPFKPVAPY
jgi:hypothetical protein